MLGISAANSALFVTWTTLPKFVSRGFSVIPRRGKYDAWEIIVVDKGLTTTYISWTAQGVKTAVGYLAVQW